MKLVSESDVDALRNSGLFDEKWYLEQYPDVKMLGMDPLEHYLWLGKKVGRHPSPRTPGIEPATASKLPPLSRRVSRPYRESTLLTNRLDYSIEYAEKLALGEKRAESGSIKEGLSSYFHPSSGNKIVFYTAIFGRYDYIRDPAYVDEGVDYICFTDQDDLRSSVFQVVKVDKVFGNNTKCARMLKTLPHIFLPGYEISIWIDSSTRVRGRNFRDLISTSLSNHDIALHSHFQRDCIYDEAAECIAQKKDSKSSIDGHVDHLKSLGYPSGNGLVETAQVIRRHSQPVAAFNEEWWSFVRDFSLRDQLSFNAVSWKLNIPYHTLDGCQWLDPYFKNYLHTGGEKASMSDNDPVTLVMLVRNALDMTKTAIESILHHTEYPSFQLVIVDNDSDAETKKYLAEVEDQYFNVKVQTNKQNESFSKANNDAAKEYPTDFYLFINNDIEIIERDWLSVLVREMKADSRTAAVGPVLLYPDYTIQSAGIKIEFDGDTVKVPATEQKVYRHSGFVDGITGGCMLVRSSVHEAIGGFDERFFYGQEDIDYCLKIRELGHRIKLLAASEVIHHESYTRTFTSRTLNNREILRLKWKGRISRFGKPIEKKPYVDLLKTNPIAFKDFGDLAADIKKNVALLPRKVDLIVGIPRSGMMPAYLIGFMLNRPVISLDEFLADLAPTRGDRPRNEIASDSDEIHALFVDDSINNGNAYLRVAELPKERYIGKRVVRQYLAVYGSEAWRNDEVMTLARCNTPRLFQWNYTNHGIAQYSCYDMDGVLCVDPTDEQNDDGRLYCDFVLNARPLYIPKYRIKAIVTSRLEKYRDITEQWLREHGVQYEHLYMLDLPSKEERIRLKAHGKFKSEVYANMSDAFLFVESNPGQAAEIAKVTKKPVICTENDKFYN